MMRSRDDANDTKLFELAEFVKNFGTVEKDEFYGELKTIYFFTEKEKNTTARNHSQRYLRKRWNSKNL